MKKLIFATGNKNKLFEAQKILGENICLSTPSDYNINEDIPETADTLKGNAILKAQYIYERTQEDCFADDTGLEIDYLNGAPGVYSARYAGENKLAKDNIAKVLNELQGLPLELRTARFKCVIALILDGELHTFEGCCEGVITFECSGSEGFGYDPIFRPSGYQASFSELSLEEKNTISHRGIAMKLLADKLK